MRYSTGLRPILCGFFICVALLLQPTVTGDDGEAVTFTPLEQKRIFQHALPELTPDPSNRYGDLPAAAHLGRYLFFDRRFSRNKQVSCATCHLPQLSFADGRPLGIGLAELERHSQSLWNTAYNRWFFWDGRADSLWSQALKPMEDEREFGADRLQIAHAVYADDALRAAYESLFGAMPPLDRSDRFPQNARPMPAQPQHPLHRAWQTIAPQDRLWVNRVFANLGKAIAAYERRLISRNSPFDRFLQGLRENDPHQQAALTPSAQRGLKLFIGKANCRLCHSGPNFSDGEFHNTGIPPAGGGQPLDPGRYAGIDLVVNDPFNAAGAFSDAPGGDRARQLSLIKRDSEHWGQFKTPGLRNVALTAPYMHQGQFPTLRRVIDFYADLDQAVFAGHHREPFLQPIQLDEGERADLVIFLESLNGENLDPQWLTAPESPGYAEGTANAAESKNPPRN